MNEQIKKTVAVLLLASMVLTNNGFSSFAATMVSVVNAASSSEESSNSTSSLFVAKTKDAGSYYEKYGSIYHYESTTLLYNSSNEDLEVDTHDNELYGNVNPNDEEAGSASVRPYDEDGNEEEVAEEETEAEADEADDDNSSDSSSEDKTGDDTSVEAEDEETEKESDTAEETSEETTSEETTLAEEETKTETSESIETSEETTLADSETTSEEVSTTTENETTEVSSTEETTSASETSVNEKETQVDNDIATSSEIADEEPLELELKLKKRATESIVYGSSEHMHFACGAFDNTECEYHTDLVNVHTQIIPYEPVNDTIPTEGYVYLTKNINLNNTMISLTGDLYICLNGFTLRGAYFNGAAQDNLFITSCESDAHIVNTTQDQPLFLGASVDLLSVVDTICVWSDILMQSAGNNNLVENFYDISFTRFATESEVPVDYNFIRNVTAGSTINMLSCEIYGLYHGSVANTHPVY